MAKDTVKTIVSMFLAFVLAGYFLVEHINRPLLINGDKYINLELDGVIDTIYTYDRGMPIVLINGQRITLNVPGRCRTYLQKNDSISKKSQTKSVTTFRDFGAYTQRIKWGVPKNAGVSGSVLEDTIKNLDSKR